MVIYRIYMARKYNTKMTVSIFLATISLLASMGCKKGALGEAIQPVNNELQEVTPRVDSTIVSYYDFDKSLGSWYEKSTYYPYSATISDTQKKNGQSLRFELRKGENKRAEIAIDPYKTPAECWYGFSIFIPESFAYDVSPESLVQFHSLPDFSLGEDWRSPPVMLGVLKDRMILDFRTNSNKVNKQDDFSFERIDLGAVAKDVWKDYVIHVKWAYDNTGIFEIWQNKKLIYSRTQKANRYNDVYYPYIKLGIYKWDWAGESNSLVTNRVVYFDEVRIGIKGTGFNDVTTLY